MEETEAQFEHEVQKAIEYTIEIENHAGEMDADDIKYFAKQIRFPLLRMLKDLQSGKVKEKKF